MAINTFNVSPQRNSVVVISTIDTSNLITAIQNDDPDTYFDSASEFSQVDIFYTHEDGRQQKKIRHVIQGSDLMGTVFWTTNAKAGNWLMTKIRAIDTDGAEHTLQRAAIGTDSDIVLT